MLGLTDMQRSAIKFLLGLNNVVEVDMDLYNAGLSLVPRGIIYIDGYVSGNPNGVLRAHKAQAKFVLDLDTAARGGILYGGLK